MMTGNLVHLQVVLLHNNNNNNNNYNNNYNYNNNNIRKQFMRSTGLGCHPRDDLLHATSPPSPQGGGVLYIQCYVALPYLVGLVWLELFVVCLDVQVGLMDVHAG
mmetsp:Transcript_58144/g.95481  ORF Transcript_58144/g.95481 Transcript_58144/m.95481 type:complete len:105 (-) Transcript_58144:162-476(-)